MEVNPLILESKDFIEAKILNVKKKFEIIYSTTKDQTKKDGIYKNLVDIEKDLRRLRENQFTEKDLPRYEIALENLLEYINSIKQEPLQESKILRNILVEKLNVFSNNQEINAIWSYLNYFGSEYLGLLSEQNLRLDYGHAYQRDRFFTTFNQTIRMVQEYGKVLEQLESSKSSSSTDYKERLIKVQSKEYRDVILKTGRFLYSIKNFIDDILESEKQGQKSLLEPDKRIEILGTPSSISGITVRQALMDLLQFVNEFISFLKIPDLKKIGDEDEKGF